MSHFGNGMAFLYFLNVRQLKQTAKNKHSFVQDSAYTLPLVLTNGHQDFY